MSVDKAPISRTTNHPQAARAIQARARELGMRRSFHIAPVVLNDVPPVIARDSALGASSVGAVPVPDGAQNAPVYRLAPAMKVETV